MGGPEQGSLRLCGQWTVGSEGGNRSPRGSHRRESSCPESLPGAGVRAGVAEPDTACSALHPTARPLPAAPSLGTASPLPTGARRGGPASWPQRALKPRTPSVCSVSGGPPAWPRILPSQNPATPQVRPAQGQGLGTASRAGDATGCCSSKKLPAAPCWLDEGKGVHSAPPDSHSMDGDQKAGARISALQGPPFLIC